jgi:DNA-binding CsgD family transcriptional regulator
LWPLDSPSVAVCVLAVRVPADLNLLTERERECLEPLAQGIETRQIAARLNVSLSTAHTHMKRAREKMGLSSVEELIAFAARHCYPSSEPLAGTPSAT